MQRTTVRIWWRAMGPGERALIGLVAFTLLSISISLILAWMGHPFGAQFTSMGGFLISFVVAGLYLEYKRRRRTGGSGDNTSSGG
ncbi:hypothetical protein JNJ66_00385 [Candidatus Saccharibacteria bacterium]|nr:hypothetical protein [Candidatus Saccharibacteria bacterium]